MQATCDARALSGALKLTKKALGVKSSLSILKYVRLEVGAGSLLVRAYDLETAIAATIPATIQGSWTVCVDARALATFLVKRTGAVILRFCEAPLSVTVECGASKVSLLGLPAEEYPNFPLVNGDVGFAIDPGRLYTAMEAVASAISCDETRPILCGMAFEVRDGCLALVATDTHRLHWREVQIEAQDMTPRIVHRPSVDALLVCLAGERLPVRMAFGSIQATCEGTNWRWQCRLIYGEFVKWLKFAGLEAVCEVEVPVSPWLEMAQSMAKQLGRSSRKIELLLPRGRGMCVVTAEGPNGEALCAEVPARTLGVQEAVPVVGFDARYLADLLAGYQGVESVCIGLTGPMEPITVAPCEVRGGSVLMPMKLH